MERLGSMRAIYTSLPSSTQSALITTFSRVHLKMGQQELCSLMHGYAKMDAQWNVDLPPSLRQQILACIRSQGELGHICVACTIYALGTALKSFISFFIVCTVYFCPSLYLFHLILIQIGRFDGSGMGVSTRRDPQQDDNRVYKTSPSRSNFQQYHLRLVANERSMGESECRLSPVAPSCDESELYL